MLTLNKLWVHEKIIIIKKFTWLDVNKVQGGGRKQWLRGGKFSGIFSVGVGMNRERERERESVEKRERGTGTVAVLAGFLSMHVRLSLGERPCLVDR